MWDGLELVTRINLNLNFYEKEKNRNLSKSENAKCNVPIDETLNSMELETLL